MPATPGEVYVFPIVFLREKLKGFRHSLAKCSGCCGGQCEAERGSWVPYLKVAPWSAARLHEEGADLVSLARTCLVLAVADRTSSSETSGVRRWFPNWCRCPPKPTLQGEARKASVTSAQWHTAVHAPILFPATKGVFICKSASGRACAPPLKMPLWVPQSTRFCQPAACWRSSGEVFEDLPTWMMEQGEQTGLGF